jgi:hypothetical protein
MTAAPSPFEVALFGVGLLSMLVAVVGLVCLFITNNERFGQVAFYAAMVLMGVAAVGYGAGY